MNAKEYDFERVTAFIRSDVAQGLSTAKMAQDPTPSSSARWPQAQERARPAKSTSHGLERSCKASRHYRVHRACSAYTIIGYLKNHGFRGIED